MGRDVGLSEKELAAMRRSTTRPYFNYTNGLQGKALLKQIQELNYRVFYPEAMGMSLSSMKQRIYNSINFAIKYLDDDVRSLRDVWNKCKVRTLDDKIEMFYNPEAMTLTLTDIPKPDAGTEILKTEIMTKIKDWVTAAKPMEKLEMLVAVGGSVREEVNNYIASLGSAWIGKAYPDRIIIIRRS